MALQSFITNFLDLVLDAAPFLLFGLLVAGLIHAWMPGRGLERLMGGRGLRDVVMGALVGAPLPICSCGVLPTVVGLRRNGVSREAATSFLVATPETSVDSVMLSYAMLGPFLAAARPVAAIFSAIVTGLMMRLLPPDDIGAMARPQGGSCCSGCGCSAGTGGGDAQSAAAGKGIVPAVKRTFEGIRYALFDIFDDIAHWLVIGLVLAAATMTWVPPDALSGYGSGIVGMAAMVLVGIPMYICATASTPIAASFLLAGVSPGAAMVFMLAGPATNIATLGVVRKEMGNKGMLLYLAGVVLTSIAAGALTDILADAVRIDMDLLLSGGGDILPTWVSALSVLVLLSAGLRLALRRVRELVRARNP